MEELYGKQKQHTDNNHRRTHGYRYGECENNAISQAEIFDEAVELDGIVLTKLDSSAKGGFVISLCSTLQIPVLFTGVGEKIEDMEPFDPEEFIDGII